MDNGKMKMALDSTALNLYNLNDIKMRIFI